MYRYWNVGVSTLRIPHTLFCSAPVNHNTSDGVAYAIWNMKKTKSPRRQMPADICRVRPFDPSTKRMNNFSSFDVHECTTSITVPMFKNKGDPTDRPNCLPARLLCLMIKIFERILDWRLRDIDTVFYRTISASENKPVYLRYACRNKLSLRHACFWRSAEKGTSHYTWHS